MEKHSNKDIQASAFALADTFDSQDMGSSDKLSLPSEPPDIRNWFSSYVYESPVLDTSDGFRWSGNKESEEELNVEESNGENENSGEFRTTRKIASNGFIKGDSFVGNIVQEDRTDMDSSDMLSLPSEPPDIRNWFSSYVYESPILDTSDGLGGSGNKERECEREQFNVEESKREKEILGDFRTTRKIASNGFVKRDSFVENIKQEDQSIQGNKWVEGKKNPPVLNNSPFKKISERSVKEKMTQNHYNRSTKDVERSSLGDENSLWKLERTFSPKHGLMSLNMNKNSGKDRRSPERFFHEGDFIEESSVAKAQTDKVDIVRAESQLNLIPVDGTSMKKSTCKSNDRENREKYLAENGFISTRKNKNTKMNDENSLQRPQQVKFDHLRSVGSVSLASAKDAIVKRKALSEITNIQNSDVKEISGKWRCPQKSKPNLGPPLKQLRLEQWVRRV
ncbi:hypothetical protein L1049_022071 [Liquidambar formosana]|uniref:Uncharacterized protein n=1 Tax=Liquidambar formosana TaxID=63359 RepID=A0AAP0RBW7_LIQFO